jgi:type IV pilus assembly protein PilY1
MSARIIDALFARRFAVVLTAAALGSAMAGTVFAQTVDLADRPLFSKTEVPGNLVLALSVEWPTASTPAYPSTSAYANTNEYLGYFDPAKCYKYSYNLTTPSSSYFYPYGAASSRKCTSNSTNALWSGNYLNYAAMQSLDIFRWVLTGGDRAEDTATTTILEKTRHSGQGAYGIFPNKEITSGTTIRELSPFRWSTMAAKVYGEGTSVVFSATTGDTSTSGVVNYTGNYDPPSSSSGSTVFYRVYIRIKACDSAVGVESNCTQYGTNYKPEGLMQQYAMQLRYGAFGYLNDGNLLRDGGVLRARMKSIGPQTPVPLSTATTNTNKEWDATTGVFTANPDPTDASDTTTYSGVAVTQSGVVNYLNRFGKLGASDYKGYDPVSELYYAATRYLKNQGNVASYSNMSGASSTDKTRWVDGFPVIRTWSDPVQYSCQRNFILGIGDVYAWGDKNLPGSTITSNSAAWYTGATEPTMPSEVSADTTVNVTTATDMVGQLEGISNLGTTSDPNRSNTRFIAGLAYDNHTKDIRSDLTGKQTIETYWLDVREAQTYESKNQYWLAAKYGGFKVPTSFAPYAAANGTSTLTTAMWSTSGDMVGSDRRPDNYFIASDPAALRDGLTEAFDAIATSSAAITSTSFSLTTAKIYRSGTASYSTTYDPGEWTGDVEGSELSFSTTNVPSLSKRWSAASKLLARVDTASGGPGHGDRKIITCCTAAGAAMPFRDTNLSGTVHARTNYATFASVAGVIGTQTKANYLAYLRGDRSQELDNGGQYRTRSGVLADIVNSKANPVGRPTFPYSDQFNPGYSNFKSSYANRKTVVYIGANDGMLHAFDGGIATACTTCGTELFAYVPSFTYGNATTGPVSGLASLGKKNFVHHPLVDATPRHADIDLARTAGSGTTTPNWRTILVGGLGKGGKGYYAIDITNPDPVSSWTSETAVASKVLWEFTDPEMGYTLGDPAVVKTKKHGWVVALPSGINNSDGKGYLFLVNPRTGALLEKIATPTGSTTTPLNMAQITVFVPSTRDFTVDAIYGADMQGNVWRFDLTAASGAYPTPTQFAQLKDASNNAQPITQAPRVDVDPDTNKRYVLIGTGRLLADSDIKSNKVQTAYAIVDGDASFGGFYGTTANPLPAGVNFPIERGELNANTAPLTGVGTSPASVMGWYYDLSVTNNIAERVNIDLESGNGIFSFGTALPNGQPCDPAGQGRLFSMKLSDGSTMLIDSAGNSIDSTPWMDVIATMSAVNLNGQGMIVFGTVKGDLGSGSWKKSFTGRRLNWREVPQLN